MNIMTVVVNDGIMDAFGVSMGMFGEKPLAAPSSVQAEVVHRSASSALSMSGSPRVQR